MVTRLVSGHSGAVATPAPAVATPASADGRQAALQRALQNLVGQQVQAAVLSKYNDGSVLIRVQDSAVRVVLPADVNVGSQVPLTVVAAQPRPTFAFSTAAGNAPALVYSENLPGADSAAALYSNLPSQDSPPPLPGGARPPLSQPGLPDPEGNAAYAAAAALAAEADATAPASGWAGGAAAGNAAAGEAGAAVADDAAARPAAADGADRSAEASGASGTRAGGAVGTSAGTGASGRAAGADAGAGLAAASAFSAAPGADSSAATANAGGLPGAAGADAASLAAAPAGAGAAGNPANTAANAAGNRAGAAGSAAHTAANNAANTAANTAASTAANAAAAAAAALAADASPAALGAALQTNQSGAVKAQSLAAQLLERAPLTPAADLPELDPATPNASLSTTARVLTSLLGAAQGPAASLVGKAALFSNGQPDPGQLAQRLSDTIAQSGLFYESHVAQWVKGERSLPELMREPQMQQLQQLQRAAQSAESAGRAGNGPDLSAAQMVNQQLHAHEQARVQWQGEAWPGQPMQWEIHREPRQGGQHQGQDGGADGEPEPVWRSGVRLRFPLLGQLDATVTISGAQIHIQMQADNSQSASTLRAYASQLEQAMAAAGAPLSSLTIGARGHDGP